MHIKMYSATRSQILFKKLRIGKKNKEKMSELVVEFDRPIYSILAFLKGTYPKTSRHFELLIPKTFMNRELE